MYLCACCENDEIWWHKGSFSLYISRYLDSMLLAIVIDGLPAISIWTYIILNCVMWLCGFWHIVNVINPAKKDLMQDLFASYIHIFKL